MDCGYWFGFRQDGREVKLEGFTKEMASSSNSDLLFLPSGESIFLSSSK